MRGKFAFSAGRSIAFVCCAIFPVSAMFVAVRVLTSDVFFDFGFAVAVALLPLVAAALLALCIFSERKAWTKLLLCGLVLLSFTACFASAFCFAKFAKLERCEGVELEQQYAAVKEDWKLMPGLSELGKTADIEYYHVTSSQFVFFSGTDYLICGYEPDEYAIQKAALEAKYVFQTGEGYPACEPAAELDGYQFRLLSTEEYKGLIQYPKEIILIGCSDEAREIVYLAFEDMELDQISSLKDFIVDDCGWKYVR